MAAARGHQHCARRPGLHHLGAWRRRRELRWTAWMKRECRRRWLCWPPHEQQRKRRPESVQTYAQLGIQQNAEWLRKAHQVQHDAVRTNNLPQLDNSDYFAEFERVRHSPQRTLATDAAVNAAATNDANAPTRLPAVRTRISVRWGDLWFVLVRRSRHGLQEGPGRQRARGNGIVHLIRCGPRLSTFQTLARVA